jgi:adenine-specific DNA-methyltransferase
MPIRYIPYYPETIEGQAILNNFTRTMRALKYRDNDKVFTRILRGMPLYEVETVETVGKAPDGNLVIRGECLAACAHLKAQGIKVDLVYIDPPFASGADYAKRVYLRRNPKIAAAMETAEQELDDDALQSFDEKMYGDIWNKEDYLNWMYENLVAIKAVMSESASIYVHLDYHIGHYVKVLMDEIFGEDNFQSELIWKRTTAHSDATGYGVNYDMIFFYALNGQVTFNQQMQPYSQDYLSRFNREDSDGRKWADGNLTAKGLSGQGYSYTYKGFTSYWRCPPETMERLDKEGRLHFTSTGGIRLKVYLDELQGMPCQALWDDIYPVNSQAAERLDYATQKPEALLKRIIEASSNPGMVVGDFFGGSGVTAKVAHDLERCFIHVDVGINSVETTRDRLLAAGAAFDVLDVKDGVALFRNPAQTMDKLHELIPGMGAAEGLSDFWAGAIHNSKLGLIPVWLPNLRDHTQRVLDRPLLNRILNEALPDLPDGVRQAVVYTIDLDDEPDLRAFIAEYNPTEIAVELRDLKQVLHEIVANDHVEHTVAPAPDGYTVEITRFISDRLIGKIEAYNQKRSANSSSKKAMQSELDESDDAEENDGNRTGAFKPLEISEDGLELIELVSLDCTSAAGAWHSDAEVKIDKRGYVSLNGKKTKTLWNARITGPQKPLRMKLRNIAGDETVIAVVSPELA